jgi:hypothetical protein
MNLPLRRAVESTAEVVADTARESARLTWRVAGAGLSAVGRITGTGESRPPARPPAREVPREGADAPRTAESPISSVEPSFTTRVREEMRKDSPGDAGHRRDQA